MPRAFDSRTFRNALGRFATGVIVAPPLLRLRGPVRDAHGLGACLPVSCGVVPSSPFSCRSSRAVQAEQQGGQGKPERP